MSLQSMLAFVNNTKSLYEKNDVEKFTVFYLRISQEDKFASETESISNQRKILTEYAHNNNFKNTIEIVDDGYTGIDFCNRPGMTKLLNMVETGSVSTVLVKDLSRFGREKNIMGIMLEIILPRYGVRFVAVSESIDSANGNNEHVPFLNILNEWHVKNTSEKVRVVLGNKAKNGEPVNGKFPYGYTYCKEQNKLIINEETASTVRLIFEFCSQGYTLGQIVKKLAEEKILTPMAYQNKVSDPTKIYSWQYGTIRTILCNEHYAGVRITGVTSSISYKQKKRILNLPENINRIENAHEPIIDKELFNLVQGIRKTKARPVIAGDNSIYSGVLFCSTCGKKLTVCRTNRQDPNQYRYICSSVRKCSKSCTPHSIIVADLQVELEVKVNSLIERLNNDENDFRQALSNVKTDLRNKEARLMKVNLGKYNKRLKELDKLVQGLYEKHILNNLSERNYSNMLRGYEDEQQNLINEIAKTNNFIIDTKVENENLEKLILLFKSFNNKFDFANLRELVDKIVVHERVAEKVTASRGRSKNVYSQKIEIYFKYVGEIV